MADEFDPTTELGMYPDKFVICGCRGFITKNNDMRDLCDRFIRNGGHFYDVLCRYDDLITYVLSREEATAGNAVKWAIPFLKANGATDHLIHQYSGECLSMMPNASRTMNYISNLMPTYITTSTMEHGMMHVMERLNTPLVDVACSEGTVDQAMFGRSESRRIRELADRITALRIPKTVYELNVPMSVDALDIKIIRTLDEILTEVIPETPAMALMESTVPMNSHKKAYRLLDVRRQTNIDLNQTLYIGCSSTDFQAMDLVRDAGGLSVSFNGANFTVRGANVAVLSPDSTVGAVLAGTFFDKGIQAVIDLASNWGRDYVRENCTMDPHLVDAMFKEHPRKIPEVYVIDRDNVDEVAEKSDRYRRKLLGI